MPDRALSNWLFGKLPAHGDFVARGIDAPTRDALDLWLTAEMERGQAVWGDSFAERYEAAPVWHFVDMDAAGCWTGGILCASTDRVGRRFPLMFAAPAVDCENAAALSAGCLTFLGQAFAQGWDADQLANAQVAAEALPWSPTGATWALVGEDGPLVELMENRPVGVIERMLEMAA
ncbi:type VI secretion system-associated protein TagF [Novosphingobium sp. AAP83]|uniref:type VI secretion system-associated protein TagF n=1 Tax=Novosphingobium sp. AAP83 TaxID=1523425 RepID=UPI0006B9ECF7|nr:type VI secretion system-associated protein TagF [Novosphingobium sp. AAP83]